MASVTNNTGQQLELWDGGNQLANLGPAAIGQQLPITITSITLGNVGYHNKRGGLLVNSNYSATFVPAGNGNPNMVRFTGNGAADIVTFS
ncbi:hypothetical protein FA048_09950 [Pedobacter polaris]|uniref:Uncharacterized protein n=1 Tax=Pedobacter polaris TaxID=2571273 RepID=A0A4U1CQU6_9SPHI|nr:hypothetical protein [Pedobacter polaris]TKC10497.1 hypothetical protein FA048_09950 [Pedobacter polaris]